ncbi:hemin transport system, permease [Rhizobium phaseoli Ch24-10]|nr:hemin transport system, permease [Rhizobium phaseoli Ch24-10]
MALPQAMTERRRLVPMEMRDVKQAGDRTRLALLTIALLVAGSIFSMLFSVTTGASDASIVDVIANMAGSEAALSARDRIIIFDIRLPRTILGFLIGASLAVSGTVIGPVPQSAGRSRPRRRLLRRKLRRGRHDRARRRSCSPARSASRHLRAARGCLRRRPRHDAAALQDRHPPRPDLGRHDAACRHRARRACARAYRPADLHGERPAAARPDLLEHGLACRRHMDEDRRRRPDRASVLHRPPLHGPRPQCHHARRGRRLSHGRSRPAAEERRDRRRRSRNWRFRRRQRRHRLRRHRRAAYPAHGDRAGSPLPAAGRSPSRRLAADLRRRAGAHPGRPGRTADRHHHRSGRWSLLPVDPAEAAFAPCPVSDL